MARFPDAGNNLSAFGLNPPAIKTIAIPNNIATWPTSALNGCTALERITTFGEEIDTPVLTVVRAHFVNCTNLRHIQIPSSVTIGNGESRSAEGSVFQQSLESIVFPGSTRSIGSNAFNSCGNLVFADFSKCEKLSFLGVCTFDLCTGMTSIVLSNCKGLTSINACFTQALGLRFADLSGCTNLQTVGQEGFASADSLTTVIFPSNLKAIKNLAFCLYVSPAFPVLSELHTVIWKGCSARPAGVVIADQAFGKEKTFDQLVSDGTIQEIFVP